jgi:hypothetical protein
MFLPFVLSELRRFLFAVQNRLEMVEPQLKKQGEKSDFGQWADECLLAVKRLLRRIFLCCT